MADLYNLLDGLEENEEQQEELVQEPQQAEEEWEEPVKEDSSALTEAAQRKLPSDEDEEDLQIGADLEDLSAPKQSVLDLPYTKLQSLWSQEIHSPELLPFDQENFDEISQALEEAEERIDTIAADGMTGDTNLDTLFASVLSVDIERVKFLFRDLLRVRLQKIEAHPLHMRTCVECMSDREVRVFSVKYVDFMR